MENLITIKTPLGMKTIRESQIDNNAGAFLKVIDCLGQMRWMAIESLREDSGSIIGTIFGTRQEIVLKKSTFLP